jgi:hypothetical protein
MRHSETVVTTQGNAAALGTYLIFRVSIWGISPIVAEFAGCRREPTTESPAET